MKVSFQKVNAEKCNFKGATILPGSSLVGGNFKASNFTNAIIAHVNYSDGDFRGCTICGVTITWGAKYGVNAKFGRDNIKWLMSLGSEDVV